MHILKLENVHVQQLPNEVLDKANIVALDENSVDLIDLWTKKISGSKMKDIVKRPISTIAFLLGLITKKEWEEELSHIPKLSNYREVGKHNEWLILERLNQAILNEWVPDVDEQETKLRISDLLVDNSAWKRVSSIFAPSATEKNYIFTDKRTFFLDKTKKQYADLFMLNIDGYTKNPDGSVKHVIEIKSKTGMLDNNIDWAGYLDLHLDQIVYYNKLTKATDGALLIIDHYSRGMKIHHLSQKDIDNRWSELNPMMNKVASAIIAIRENKFENAEQMAAFMETVNWGTEELITYETFVERARRLIL